MPKSQKQKAKDKPYTRTTQDNSSSVSNIDVEEPSVCPICEEIVKEPSDDGKDPGDEALFCEGKCEAWYHRKCVGLSCVLTTVQVSLITHFIVFFACNSL